MKKRFLFLTVLFFAFLVPGAFTQSLSIQIIQNNVGQSKIWDTSYFFEQCVTDYFFDSGKIVSSSPIWIRDNESEQKNQNALKAALAENLEGGMEYLVRIELFYHPAEKRQNPSAILLSNLEKAEWKCYLVKTGVLLMEGEVPVSSLSAQNNNETGLQDFANLVAKKINTELKKLK